MQVTIPSVIARAAHIKEGDVLEVGLMGTRIVLEKAKDELPIIRIGRKVGDEEIERLISESAEEISG